MKIRVYYEDTDLGGVVYHSKYLNFCERARSELFFQKGALPVYEGYHFVVKRVEADFLKSSKLGDILSVETKVIETKKASLKLLQTIFKENEEIFRAIVTLVCMKDGKIAKIPSYFLDVLEEK